MFVAVAVVALASSYDGVSSPVVVEAWTTTPPLSFSRLGQCKRHRFEGSASSSRSTSTSTTTTVLFGKKKNKKKAGEPNKAATKIQVKLLQSIAGTGQVGDVLKVSPIFYNNKLRPQKLAIQITDDEVAEKLATTAADKAATLHEAKVVEALLTEDNSNEDEMFVLEFQDNQTGPDGVKLFGGIGPKKILDMLKQTCPEFAAYTTNHPHMAKQVTIVDVEEQAPEEEEDEAQRDASETAKSKYVYTTMNDIEDDAAIERPFVSLPKTDKLTIKRTGNYRIQVSLATKYDKEDNIAVYVRAVVCGDDCAVPTTDA